MKTTQADRYSALSFRHGKGTRNRVVVPPMASETADARGFVTQRTLEHYARLAESGAGIVMVEYTYVDPRGRSEENQLGAYIDEQVEGLAKVAAIIHASGALAGLQLTHAGGKTSPELTGGEILGPSDVPVPVKNTSMPTPTPMSASEISLFKEAFLAGARRAKLAGFDIVEFHSAHGYGLNQWLSCLTNRREDSYGGSLSNRARLLLECLQLARAGFPDLLFSVRLPGQDFSPQGLSSADAIEVARALEGHGVDLINVSSGIGGWRRPGPRVGEGYLVAEAEAIQAEVHVPVIGVGGIETGAYIDQVVAGGKIALAAVGRAILADPLGWKRKNLSKGSP